MSNQQATNTPFKSLAKLILEARPGLTFTMLEIGGVPIDDQPEPFHQLIELFPGSKNIAFEIDEDVCEELNQKAKPGIEFHPVAIGRTEEQRPLYIANHPMCSSLYKPNDKLNSRYTNLTVALLKSTTTITITTQSLDFFTEQNNIGPIDFIKIDIQGAELDAFQGGTKALQDTLAIISEVEFIEHYENQPLFGDVCAFLAKQNIEFQNFISAGSRSPKPIIVNNNPNMGSQAIWADAMFIRSISQIQKMDNDQLLKLAILSLIYNHTDYTLYYFSIYDQRNGSKLALSYQQLCSPPPTTP